MNESNHEYYIDEGQFQDENEDDDHIDHGIGSNGKHRGSGSGATDGSGQIALVAKIVGKIKNANFKKFNSQRKRNLQNPKSFCQHPEPYTSTAGTMAEGAWVT